MKFIINKSKLVRNNYLGREYFLLTTKSIFQRHSVASNVKNLMNVFNKKYSFSTHLKNRCYLTGRSSSVDSYTHVSRMRFREFAHKGKLIGLKKSSW